MMKSEAGSVTAEFAVTLPAVLSVFALLFSLLGLQVERVQLVTTSGVAARAASHLMTDIEVQVLVAKLAPGSTVQVSHDAEVVCASVTKNLLISITEKICTRMQGQ